jgi:hypothetical protein
VPASTVEVDSAGAGRAPGAAPHAAIKAAIAAITVRSANERIVLVLVMGTRHRPPLATGETAFDGTEEKLHVPPTLQGLAFPPSLGPSTKEQRHQNPAPYCLGLIEDRY